MVTKHFLKTLILFATMICLGLLGIFLVSYFEKSGETTITVPTCKEGELC